MKQLKSISVLIVSLVVALGLSGCGKKLTEKAMEKALEKATNEAVDLDLDQNGGLKVNTNEGEWSLGSKASVPSDFPSDMPVYSGAQVISSAKDNNPTTWSVILQTSDSMEKVYTYYQTQLAAKGWTVDSTYDYGEIKSLGVSKTGYSGTVMVSKSDEKTAITLTVAVKEE